VSGPLAIEVDEGAGLVRWRADGQPMEVEAPGAFAARHDSVADRLVVLARNGDRGAVILFSRWGERLVAIEPPAGYAISHFAGEGTSIVCQGESSDAGWWDWHFDVDAPGATLVRAGPAY
jgi:hypothetical protein